ncbi:MAG: DUF192 domain-containing protein [Chloroflexi bacterium]|nr:DUF192 domain-containing protein [Chloroflexota bacterium]
MVKGCLLRLEVANTPEEASRGLMDRPSLPGDAAMLFIYKEEEHLTFWMLNTLITLDILFLDKNGIIVDTQRMVPEPGIPREKLTLYRSVAKALYALEMNAGLAERSGIRVGDEVELYLQPLPPGQEIPQCAEAGWPRK